MTDKLRPSTSFANCKDVQKLVDDETVVGFVVFGGGRETGASVSELLRAEVQVRGRERGKPVLHVLSSYEHGERLNGNFYEDEEGAILAQIAAAAIAQLTRRAQRRKLIEQEDRRARRKRPHSRTRKRSPRRDR